MRVPSLVLLGTLVVFAPSVQAQSNLRSAPSTRATAELTLITPPASQGQPAGPSYTVKIDYGQPHARGRDVQGALKADLDTVWRLGANNPTTLTTGTDIVIGGLTVPKGSYVLWARTSSRGAWKLIVSRDMGNTYDRTKDLGSVDLTSKTLSSPVESLTIALVPGPDGAPRGDLRISWGTREFTTTWAVK